MKKVKTQEPTGVTGEEMAKSGCFSLIVGLVALGIVAYSIYVLCS